MGGCRCTYRNCTVKSDKNSADTKIHMFHYPAYEKLRCRLWIINAQKYEFLDLKVSQLRNRVVCQFHFKDDCFMNYKKDKLTFEAVPTEDGPYCDSTKELMVNEEILEKVNLVLNDIDQDVTYIDKKANSSLKYIDFLANADPPMVSEQIKSLSIDDSTNSALKNVNKDRFNIIFEHCKPEENIKFNKKHSIMQNPITPIKVHNNHVRHNYQIRKGTEVILQKNSSPKREPNILFDNNKNHNITNVPLLPVAVTTPNSYESIEQVNQQPPQIVYNTNLGHINNNPESQLLFNNNLQKQTSGDTSLFNQPYISVQANNNVKKEQVDVKVKILSETTLLKPLPFVGKLEPVLPSLILPVPNRLKDKSFNQPQISQSVSEISQNVSEISQNVTVHEPTNCEMGAGTSEVLAKNDIVIREPPKIEILESEADNSTTLKPSNISCEQKINSKEKTTETASKLSILKTKVSPERLAAIEKKRIFNKKLRDMVETCLEKPKNQDKLESSNILKAKYTENVDTSISKGTQDYTIAYLESRMNKMQNILLQKIEQNSSRIMEIKNCIKPQKHTSVSTQTPTSTESYKVYLYDEISKFLSPKAKNLLYEDLFIYKYSQSNSDCDTKTKRKRYR